jgi:anti-sigma regulatory factor (Ser/Thr protein kinase)
VPEKAAREIRLVAGALDRVQGTAFALASEQALVRRNITASLANLGRRNQNLLRRQLGLISEFERAELDPTTLANLFELDHLATRMRRNAESLLVLVGENGPRPWGRPLPVTDVIRAALSEVDDYRRVAMRRVDDAHISGAVVAEVAHMLAELVENALAFSSPDLEVEIYGRATDRGYLLVVLDHGVGMSADELAKARARLRDEENFLVTPTRFLGHYVVGRLARRLAVTVELYESPVTGITARMILPSDLLADPSSGDDTPVAANVPASPPAKTTESADSASATNGAKGINGIAAKRITWPGGIPADVDTAGEMNTVDTPDVVPAQNSGGRNGHHRADPERTRNGLVKRHPRARPSVHRPNPSRPQPDREAPVRDRTPTEVSTMLAAFRGGHQRGESTQPPTEGS